jgi:predicted esterase
MSACQNPPRMSRFGRILAGTAALFAFFAFARSAAADSFCIPGVEALGEDACYVAPKDASGTLLVYLHGILPPAETSRIKTNFETVVKNAAERLHVVALLPRGKQGIAPPGHDGWWAWPTTGSAYDRYGAKLAEKMSAQRTKLEALLHRKFERVYLAGSSSGAYFVSALAVRGDFAADGYGVLSGGAPFWAPKIAELAPRPVYVGYGLFDTVKGSCSLLVAQLRRAKWPVQVSELETGHGARDVYLDEAFAFWATH